MTNQEYYAIDVYTRPSDWSRPTRPIKDIVTIPQRRLAYRRIVGLEAYGGEVLWDGSSRGDPDGDYRQSQVGAEKMPVNDTLHRRLTEYYLRQFVDPRADPWRHNCHDFAETMAATTDERTYILDGLPDTVQEIMRGMSLLDEGARVALGSHAIYGAYIDEQTPVAVPSHSVVGLGESCDDEPYGSCLYVVAWSGHLGLSTYDRQLDEQRTDTEALAEILHTESNPKLVGFGLYAA